MSRFERTTLGILILAAVALWAAVGYKFNQTWQQPLGPQLALPTYTSLPEVSSAAVVTATPRPTAGPTNTSLPGEPTLTPYMATENNPPLCGGPKVQTILLIGSSTHNNDYLYGLADVIRLVRVDFTRPRVTVLEFPRDLWVEIPEIDNHYNITHGKLNQPYFYGNKGMGYYQGPGEGPGLLARTLDLNFGARTDHYIAINMQTFVRVINRIGGIDVYLPNSVDGRKSDQASRSDLYFAAGPHHLNGDQALMLARIREHNVFERGDQQNRVFCAVRAALLSPQNLARLPQLVDAFDGAVQTDLSPQQISQLACLVPELEPRNISFITFPLNLLKEARRYDASVQKEVFIFESDFNILRLYVNAFKAGVWPQSAPLIGENTSAPTNAFVAQTGFSCK